jgi:hypothetical protein
MQQKPHIVRMVADRARELYYTQRRLPIDIPRPRIEGEEIGVRFGDGQFIAYADLGFHHDLGFYRLSDGPGLPNEAAPFAAMGKIVNAGHVVVTTGVSERLTPDEISDLVRRHTTGDFGRHGDFYAIDVTDEELRRGSPQATTIGVLNKIGTLSGLGAIISEYWLRGYRIWVITESGHNRSTVLIFAGLTNETAA